MAFEQIGNDKPAHTVNRREKMIGVYIGLLAVVLLRRRQLSLVEMPHMSQRLLSNTADEAA